MIPRICLAGLLSCGLLFAQPSPTATSLSVPACANLCFAGFGQPVVLVARVNSGGASIGSIGSVTFLNGATILGVAPVSTGTATLSTSLLPAGNNSLTAVYQQNGSYGSSVSSPLSIGVSARIGVGFGTANPISTGGTGPYSVVVADMNFDGIADLVVTNSVSSPGSVSVLLGNGSGGFSAPATFTTGSGPKGVAVGDFNGDGKPDIAVANSGSNTVSILLNTSASSASLSFAAAVSYPAGTQPMSIVVADFNGDGIPDLAITDFVSTETVSVLFGVGNGTFPSAPSLVLTGVSGYADGGLAAADFNGDGRADIAVGAGGYITVFLNTGSGTFGSANNFNLASAAPNPIAFAVADFNGDGKPDIAMANYEPSPSGTVTVVLNATINGVLTFGSPVSYVVGANPAGISVGDFDGDGHPDIAVTNLGDSTVSVLLGSSSGSLTPQRPNPYNAPGAPYGVAVGDFNGDGVYDIVTADNGAGVSVLLGTPAFFLGNQITMAWYNPNLSTLYQGPATAVVNSTVEFPNFSGTNQAFAVQFNDRAIIIQSNTTSSNSFAIGGGVTFNGLVITNPGTGTIPNFSGVALSASNWLDTNGNPFTRSRISFDSTHIYVDFQGMVNLTGDYVALTVNPSLTPSTTVLNPAPNPSPVGSPVALVATVTPGATGTVSFFQNSVNPANLLGTATLSGSTVNVAALTVSTLPLGATSIIAFYNGDSTYNSSTSSSVTENVVNLTSTTLQSLSNPANTGASITFTATVLPNTATGTVVFTADSSTLIGTGTLSSGVATVSTSSLTAGSHAIMATYTGDSSNFGSASNTVTQVVQQTTTTTLASSLNPSPFGTPVTITATVAPSAATGTVTFEDGSATLGTSNLSGGAATFTSPAFAIGSHSITAVYSGDSNYPGSSSAVWTQTVSTTINLFSDNFESGALVSQDTNWVTNSTGLVVPDPLNPNNHVLEFTADGGAGQLFSAPIPNNSANYYLSFDYLYVNPPWGGGFVGVNFPGELWLGGDCGGCYGAYSTALDTQMNNLAANQWHHIQIPFPDFSAGTPIFTLKLEQFEGTAPNAFFDNIALSASGFGQQQLTIATPPLTPALVNIPYTATLVSGGITPYVCSVSTGSLPAWLSLNPTTCVLSGTPPAVGSSSFTIAVLDSELPQQGASQAYTLSVQQPTTTTLTSSLNPSAYGAAVTLTATVSPASATGTVTFSDGGSPVGTGTLNGSGVATYTTSVFAGGSHSLTASYGGDTNDTTSASSAVTQVVNQTSTTTILTSSANPAAVGQTVTFTATVSSPAATGSITFMDGSSALGSPVALSGGVATLTTSSLAAGPHTLVASYSGDGNFTASSSHLITIPLNFSAAVAGTIADSTGKGTGFTTRLPGTGASLAANDPNLTLNTGTGTLTLRSTPADLNGQNNLGVAEYFGIPLSAVGAADQDFAVSAMYNSIQYSQTYDQIGVFAGSASTSDFRAGVLYTGTPTAYTVQTPGNGDQNLQQNTALAPNAGDTVIMTLSRTSGVWTFNMQDLTTPSKSGNVAVTQPTYLNGLNGLVAGVYAANPGNATSKTETISAFAVAVGTQQIGPLTATSTTTLTSSSNPSIFGLPVTLTATVSPSTATGTVTFMDRSTTLGTATLSNGNAALTISTLSVATHSLTASYPGDANDTSSISSALAQIVNQASTTTTLTSSQNPATSGASITLTASVSPSTATGTVAFRDNGNLLATAALSAGVAKLSISTLSYGTHTLTATYSGDANGTQSVSAPLSQSITFPSLLITTQSLPAGQVGAPYGPVTMQASGGSGSYTWSASGLPAGISMSSSGALGGSAAVAFSGSVSITVSDNISRQSFSSSYTLSVTSSTLTISGTSSLGAVAVGGSVSGSFSASGGIPPYTWSLSGAPGGFSVSANGAVSGSSSSPGNSGFSLVVKDSTPGNPLTASLGLTFSVFGITTGSLPSASTLSSYGASINAAGGSPPYAITASGFPAGLSFSGSTISGRATTPGTYSITVNASDSKGLTASAGLSLLVTGAGPLQVLSTSLAAGTVTQPYSQTLNAEGGSPAYTWSQSGGTLPPGLSLTSGGTVFGQPTLSGSYSFGVQANDTSGGHAVGAISITIQPAPLQITTGAALPAGIVGSPYPSQVLSATGGVAPYAFSIQGTLPAGLTVSNGQISGTPTAAGSSGFNLIVTDSASPASTATLGMSVTVRPNSADLILSAGTASFSLATGTSAAPSPNSITIGSSSASQPLSFTVNASAPWLTVNSGSTTPANLSVGLSSAALALTAAGSPYSGNVVVTCTSGPCSGNSQTIGVSLAVNSPAPELNLSASIFSFDALTTNPQPSSAVLGVQNSGGGTLNLTSVTSAASWISIGSFPATVAPGPGAAVSISENPAGLPAGYYTSTISVSSSAGNSTIPVNLLVSAKPSMVLGPAGAQFSMPQGGALGNSAGSFLVSVSSTTPVSYTASVQSGATWLTGGGGGSASSASPGTVNFSLNAAAIAALPVGAYYGTIQVTGSGIVNTPQSFQVVLNISPANTPVVVDPEPGGLLFLSSSSAPLPPQTIQVFASSVTPLPFQASATTNSGSGWLSISSASGSSVAGSPAQILVSVTSAGLAAGVYTGAVNFASGPSVRSVNITLVVEPPLTTGSALQAAVSGLKPDAASPTCANAKLVPASTGLGSNFAAPASWPTPITVTLVDTCGSVIGKGQIVATFSTGDPPLELSPVNVTTGTYSGTWTPRKTSGQVIINAQATATGYSAATVQIGGQVTPNSAPQLTANGTLDVFNPQVGAGLGPGNIVQIYGTSLANQSVASTTLPLPTKVLGTQVLIGGMVAPLFYVSPTQINAQIPFELNAGQQYQVIVSANGAVTTPQPIQLNSGTPAVLQFTSGLLVAQHPDGTLVSTASPAAPGEFIVLYMTGLGATDIPVPSGQPSPSSPPANVLDVPTLTLNNNPVPVIFAGLTPGLVGLYQLNIQVPLGLTTGTYTLNVSQDGVTSNPTSLAVLVPAPQ